MLLLNTPHGKFPATSQETAMICNNLQKSRATATHVELFKSNENPHFDIMRKITLERSAKMSFHYPLTRPEDSPAMKGWVIDINESLKTHQVEVFPMKYWLDPGVICFRYFKRKDYGPKPVILTQEDIERDDDYCFYFNKSMKWSNVLIHSLLNCLYCTSNNIMFYDLNDKQVTHLMAALLEDFTPSEWPVHWNKEKELLAELPVEDHKLWKRPKPAKTHG